MQNKDNEISMGFFLEPYKGLVEKQEKERLERELKEEKKNKKVKAYLITTPKIPEFYFLTFISYKDAYERAKKKNKYDLYRGYEQLAIVECTKYLAESIGLKDTSNGIYFSLNKRRAPSIDRFHTERVAPIYELLKIGLEFRCKNCGKGKFNLEDYENKECRIVEGEGEYNPFTRGIILCKECYDNLFTYEP